MGTNFLAVCIGGLTSGAYTWLYGRLRDAGHPEYVWYIMTAHLLLAILVLAVFKRLGGEFKEQEA
jgi:hypothetical protein